MASSVEIRNLALKKLGKYSQGQSLNAAAAADIDAAYLEYYDELNELGLTTWAIGDDVPARLAQPIADRIAYMRALNYGVSAERLQVLTADSMTAEYRIRRAVASDYIATTERISDF